MGQASGAAMMTGYDYAQAAGVGLTAAGGATQAYGEVRAGHYNAQVARLNARVADQQALSAIERGKIAEGSHRRSVAQLIGAQRAGYAGQNVVVDQDTAGQMTEDTAALGELDALTIRNNAALEAWGYRVNAVDSRARAALARAEGNNRAIGTILTSGAQVARYSQA